MEDEGTLNPEAESVLKDSMGTMYVGKPSFRVVTLLAYPIHSHHSVAGSDTVGLFFSFRV
jgi:hypothetical protein